MVLTDQPLSFVAMGSPCEIKLCAKNPAIAMQVSTAAMQEVMRLEQKYSLYDPNSYLSSINKIARDGGSIIVDQETAKLFDIALGVFQNTNGLFDITSGLLRKHWNDDMQRLPRAEDLGKTLENVGLEKLTWKSPELSFLQGGMTLDFGGIVKEYAVDAASSICQKAGIDSGIVNLGGDIFVLGPRPDGAPWHIGIRNPFGGREAFVTLFLDKGGIATSGSYERFWEIDGQRYSHIVNPKTGWPVDGLLSVTVLADTCLEAGLAATTALLYGIDWQSVMDSSGLKYFGIGSDGKSVSNLHISAQPQT